MIVFNEEEHRYYNTDTSEEYISATTFISNFKPKFESKVIAIAYGKKHGIPVEMVLDVWNQEKNIACRNGTIMHKMMEDFINEGIINESINYSIYESLQDIIKESQLGKILSEFRLYNHQYKLAGTTDLLIQDDTSFSLLDFKTNKRIRMESEYNESFNDPISHMHVCEFNTYSLQLSLYAYMFEVLSNKRCNKLSILHLVENKWILIPVTYLREDIEKMLEFYKQNINSFNEKRSTY